MRSAHLSTKRVLVAITRCQSHGEVPPPNWVYLTPGIPISRISTPQGRDLLVPEIPTPPPPNRLTDTCENITFLQLLLQAVIRNLAYFLC